MKNCLNCGFGKILSKETAILIHCSHYQASTFVRSNCPNYIDYDICSDCNIKFANKKDPLLLCKDCRRALEREKKFHYNIREKEVTI